MLQAGYETPSRIADEIPIAPLSKGATDSRVWFLTWTGLSTVVLWSERARSR